MASLSRFTFLKCRLIIGVGLFSLSNLSLLHAETKQLVNKTLTINNHALTVEVANTPSQRQQGLMFRKTLAAGQGMLFDFNEEVSPCFWMKNTYIPLSIAYINSHYQITQIATLEPLNLTPICSQVSIRYALEVPQGWFTKQGITEGMLVKGFHP